MTQGTRKSYPCRNGVDLIVDATEFIYHGQEPTHQPTVKLHIERGSVVHKDATLAARRVYQSIAHVHDGVITVSTTAEVKNYAQAMSLCDAFTDQLKKLLRLREQGVRNKARGAGDGRYVNSPQI